MTNLHFHRQKILYIAIGFVVLLLFLWLNSLDPEVHRYESDNPKIQNVQSYKENIDIDIGKLIKLKKEWILINCLQQDNIKHMSLEFLPEYINKFEKSYIKDCKYIGEVFLSMFELDKIFSDVRLSSEFSQRVLKWLDNNQEYLKQATHQKVIKLYNKYTSEEAIFNPLRGKRPIAKPEISDKKFSQDMIGDSQKTCDFCNNYTKNTADDVFERIETNLSYTSANTFKYDKWHGLILARKHNPLTLNQEEFVDMFSTALNWYKEVKKLDKNAKYPSLMWDVMPKSGASQVHPHFQTSLGVNNYYGALRRWLDASKRYYYDNNRNFFDDFILIHNSLGLSYKYRSAYLIANLIPIKEQELILIAENSQQGYDDLVKLLHETIKIFINDLELYSWSLGMFMPPYTDQESFFTVQSSNENDGNLNRIFCRIVFRFPAAALRSDYNGLDMYTSSVLGIDRYQIANNLFTRLEALNMKN